MRRFFESIGRRVLGFCMTPIKVVVLGSVFIIVFALLAWNFVCHWATTKEASIGMTEDGLIAVKTTATIDGKEGGGFVLSSLPWARERAHIVHEISCAKEDVSLSEILSAEDCRLKILSYNSQWLVRPIPGSFYCNGEVVDESSVFLQFTDWRSEDETLKIEYDVEVRNLEYEVVKLRSWLFKQIEPHVAFAIHCSVDVITDDSLVEATTDVYFLNRSLTMLLFMMAGLVGAVGLLRIGLVALMRGEKWNLGD